jgi:hypothetical protein
VSATADIPAPASTVYRVIADYREHHPRIVPPEHFRNMRVLEGGFGAGTRTMFDAHVLGTTHHIHHVVSEPEPGRVLVERDVDGPNSTTFTIEPTGTQSARLTIESNMNTRGGLAGVLERWMTAAVLRRIYQKELARIAAYAPRVGV